MKKRYKSYKLDNRHVELEIEELKGLMNEKVSLREESERVHAEILQLQNRLNEVNEQLADTDRKAAEQEERIIYLMKQQGKTEVVVSRVRYFLSKDRTSLERELILPSRS